MQPRHIKAPSRRRRLAGTHQVRKHPSPTERGAAAAPPLKKSESNGFDIPPPATDPSTSINNATAEPPPIMPTISKMPSRKPPTILPILSPEPSPPPPAYQSFRSSLATLNPPLHTPSHTIQIPPPGSDSPTLTPSPCERPQRRTITPTHPLPTTHGIHAITFEIDAPARGMVAIDGPSESEHSAAGPQPIDLASLKTDEILRIQRQDGDDDVVLNMRYPDDVSRRVRLRWL